jgi:nicotinamide-nucleotide amidase
MNRNKKINLFVKTMVEENITLALGESMTCGLAAHLLSTCKGTSQMLKGSIVCYNPQVKTETLGIPESIIKKYTAESAEVTERIAKKISNLISADVHASITGLASAGGSETKQKPVGTVFYSIRYKKKIYNSRKLFYGTPLQIREKACLQLYDLILRTIKSKE